MTGPDDDCPPEHHVSNSGLALVLPGGGARGAYQAGVLARLTELCPEFAPEVITGVSAGSINAAYLANRSGSMQQAAAALADLWCQLASSRIMETRALRVTRNVLNWGTKLAGGGRIAVDAGRALFETAPLREFLFEHLAGRPPGEGKFPEAGSSGLAGVRNNLEQGRLRALAVTATSYTTGKAITFSQSNDVGRGLLWHRPYREGHGAVIGVEHVMASCALPLLFPAVEVGPGHWYGDGSIRQVAPLSPALHLGARRLLLIGTARPPTLDESFARGGYPSPARVAGVVLNALMFDGVDFDATYLHRVTSLLRRSPAEHPRMREAEVSLLRPSQDLGRLAADFERHVPRALRYLTRGLGSMRRDASDLMSTLLFEGAYTSTLVALGRQDAEHAWPRLRRFLVGKA
jgi:NTE family protein